MKLGKEQWDKVRSLSAYALGPAMGLISGPVLARALGPSARGEFAAVMQPMTVATGLACMGVPSAITYFVASGSGPGESLRRSLLLVAPAGLATYAGMAVYANYLADRSGVPLVTYLLAWALIPVGAFIQVLRGYWQGRAGWRRLDAERVLSSVLKFLAIVGLAAVGLHQASSYVALQILAILLPVVVLVTGLRSVDRAPAPSWRALSRYSVSSWATLIFLYAGSRLDQALMPAASTSHQLGWYAVAVTASEVALVPAALISRDAFHSASQGLPIERILRKDLLYWLAVAAACLGSALIAPWLVPLAFGSDFRGSVRSVQVLCISSFATAVILFCVAVLSGYARPRLSAVGPLVSIVVTLAGFVALWGHVSSVDASWISAVSQSLGALTGIVLINRVRKLRSARADGPTT